MSISTSRWGIAVGYTYAHDKFQGAILDEKAFLKYGHEHMVIRNNYVMKQVEMALQLCMRFVRLWNTI